MDLTHEETKAAILKRVEDGVLLANTVLQKVFLPPVSTFSLRGMCAGKTYSDKNLIKWNLELAHQNFQNFIDDTVAHELSHIIANKHFGKHCHHGYEWKWVMKTIFGKEPSRCHNYDVSAYKRSRTRYVYSCSCGQNVFLTKKAHISLSNNSVIIVHNPCRNKLQKEHFCGFVKIDPTGNVQSAC